MHREETQEASPVGALSLSPYYRISNAPSPYFLPPQSPRDFLRRLPFPLALTSFSIKLPTFNRSWHPLLPVFMHAPCPGIRPYIYPCASVAVWYFWPFLRT